MSQYAECRHMMPSGKHCQSPALRNSIFCYAHSRPQASPRMPRSSEAPFSLAVVLEARTSQQACNEVLQALASNHISNRRAAVLLHGIQMATTQSSDDLLPVADDGELEIPADLREFLRMNNAKSED